MHKFVENGHTTWACVMWDTVVIGKTCISYLKSLQVLRALTTQQETEIPTQCGESLHRSSFLLPQMRSFQFRMSFALDQ
jgi:hypothetical protein